MAEINLGAGFPPALVDNFHNYAFSTDIHISTGFPQRREFSTRFVENSNKYSFH
jgi:hypothetical protein